MAQRIGAAEEKELEQPGFMGGLETPSISHQQARGPCSGKSQTLLEEVSSPRVAPDPIQIILFPPA